MSDRKRRCAGVAATSLISVAFASACCSARTSPRTTFGVFLSAFCVFFLVREALLFVG